MRSRSSAARSKSSRRAASFMDALELLHVRREGRRALPGLGSVSLGTSTV